MTPQEERNKRFDEKFKCIQSDCDGTGHIPEQISEDEWTSSQCQFHAEYLLPFKSFLQSEIDLAIADYQTNFEQKHIASAVIQERERIAGLIEEKPMSTFSFHLTGKELDLYMQHKGWNKCRDYILSLITKD